MSEYDRLCIRIICALTGDILPDSTWHVPDMTSHDLDGAEEERIAAAVCETTGMSLERWDRLSRNGRIPWLHRALRAIEKQPAPNVWPLDHDLPTPELEQPGRERPAPEQPAEERPAPEDAEEKGAGRKGKRINERILQLLVEKPESVDWTAEEFAGKLDCSSSTVVDTKAWEKIMSARALREANWLERRNSIPPTDRRRRPKKKR